MPDRALPTLLPWQVEVLNRLWAGEQFVISMPRINGRTSLRRWVQSWDDVHAIVFLNYLKVWDAPGSTMELTTGHGREDGPPYLGAWPWPCTCEYFVFDCPWPARWAIASGFRIHSDCPQHGDDALC